VETDRQARLGRDNLVVLGNLRVGNRKVKGHDGPGWEDLQAKMDKGIGKAA
jgi:hypothetical protein